MLNAVEYPEFPADTLAAVKPLQADPAYLNALGALNDVTGIRAIATCVAFIRSMHPEKSEADVLHDANALADVTSWAPLQAEFDRIHHEAGVA